MSNFVEELPIASLFVKKNILNTLSTFSRDTGSILSKGKTQRLRWENKAHNDLLPIPFTGRQSIYNPSKTRILLPSR